MLQNMKRDVPSVGIPESRKENTVLDEAREEVGLLEVAEGGREHAPEGMGLVDLVGELLEGEEAVKEGEAGEAVGIEEAGELGGEGGDRADC